MKKKTAKKKTSKAKKTVKKSKPDNVVGIIIKHAESIKKDKKIVWTLKEIKKKFKEFNTVLQWCKFVETPEKLTKWDVAQQLLNLWNIDVVEGFFDHMELPDYDAIADTEIAVFHEYLRVRMELPDLMDI